jgi:hypothetical protein
MMKKAKKNSPIWPYLGILACLFLLSLTAPRAWDRHVRREPVKAASTPAPSGGAPSGSVVQISRAAILPQALELSDASELAPREAEFTIPTLATPTLHGQEFPGGLMPPAPEFAADFPSESLNLATLPALPELPAESAPELTQPQDVQQLEAPAAEPEAETEPALPNLPSEEPVATTPAEPPVEATPAPSAWPLPRKLVEQLTNLAHEDPQLIWPRRAIQLIEELNGSDDDQSARRAIAQLRDLAASSAQVPGGDSSLQSQIARAQYGLTRWVDIWEGAAKLRAASHESLIRRTSPEKIQTALREFETLAGRNPAGAGWREYLQLDAIRRATAQDATDEERRKIARSVLDRVSATRLSSKQREFIDSGALSPLSEELRGWAAEPIAAEQLLAHLEQLEYSGLESDSTAVASDYRNLTWMIGDAAEQLARHLDTHYRNANLRVAVSGELANRVLPQPGRINAPVRDTVVNVPVRGQSSTFTRLSLVLVPDPKRVRIGMEAHGVVDANTISSAGPATIRNRGQSTFLVRKLFVLGPRGLHVWPAIAEAENNYNYLVSLETDYDGVPLVGPMVRNIARSQYDEKSGEARRQTEQKVAVRALHQLDSEIQTRLQEAGKKVETTQGATLKRLGLELVPISLATTEERIVARARLSSSDQLGAHTPRPRAPSDSWFSLQVHESALNNSLAQLGLEGRTFKLPELFAWIAEKTGQPGLANQEDLPENVQVTFADRDAIRLECVNNRIGVTLSLAELTHEKNHWRNFQVHTFYDLQADGLSPRFSREAKIEMLGPNVRGMEIKLRTIFSKVLSKNRDLRLLADSITSDPRFKDLQMTQFTVDDGWIALAYSPRRVSSNVARQPSK